MSTSTDTNRIETGDLLIETNADGDIEIHNLSTGTSFTLGSSGVTVPEFETTTSATINGRLLISGSGGSAEEGIELLEEMDIYSLVDSSQSSGDAPNFNVTISDSQGNRPEIHWRRHVHNSSSYDEAFGVYDNTNNSPIFRVRESGAVVVDEGSTMYFPFGADIQADVDSAAGNDNQEWNIQHHDESGADEIHWLRNAAETEAFAIRNNTVGYSNRLLSLGDDGSAEVSGPVQSDNGYVAPQRGAPTTAELDAGERMQYTSDGSDGNTAGDLVSARNDGGTIVSQVIAAAADDA